MEGQSTSDPKFELGHVLFIDIVGYSKLLINEQTELLRILNDAVRKTEQVRSAEAEGKLVRLPTGDGMALVFRTTPETPARCALEISHALQSHPDLKVRMGIHSGPVNEISDVNERANRSGNQHCAAGNGLRRRGTHIAIQTRRGRSRELPRMAAMLARPRSVRSEAWRHDFCRKSLQRHRR